jgi:hypothetical protein
LVYEAGFNEYLGFLCDAFPGVFANPMSTCAALAAAGIPTDASDLNYPSIAVADLPGITTVTRTVTSVARDAGNRRYTVSVDAPPGYSVSVSPSTITLRRGQSATYEVTIVNESAPVGEWRFGSLTWTDRTGNYEARSPIAVRGVPLSAPGEVTFSGESGSGSFDVLFGYTGPYTATGLGLVGDTGEGGTVEQDPDQSFSGCNTPLGDGEVAHTFSLASAAHLRITMDQDDVVGAADTDIDLFLCRGNSLVASSTSPNTAEQIDLSQPNDGSYTLIVHGWGVPSGRSATRSISGTFPLPGVAV